MANYNRPAISVIVSVYNAEKYIGECLDSILAQTFTDFELIVVDDCSTDNSVAIVKSYAEKFGGRLRIVKTQKNSGSATEPRNLGINYSCGEYLYFMDNDDTVTATGLAELYAFAKKFDADVVQCEKNYNIPDKFYHDAEYLKNHKPSCYPANEKIFITEPTLLDEDLAKRAVSFSRKWLTWSIWIQLIRRDFIVENQLRFVGVVLDDLLFTICEICSAKKYLVVPNVIYKHRERSDSLLWQDVPNAEKFVKSRITMLREGIGYLDKFLSAREPFARRPDLKYALFDMFASDLLDHFGRVYPKIPAPALDPLIRKEFFVGDDTALMSFIISKSAVQLLQLKQNQQKFNFFALKAQRRIAELETEIKRLKGLVV